jgi:hypothetical protein
VTGPPLAHGPFGPASHLSAGAGNTAPVAYSLPPHLYLPPMNPGPVGSYSPPRMTFGENHLFGWLIMPQLVAPGVNLIKPFRPKFTDKT